MVLLFLLAGLGGEGEADHFGYFIFGGRPAVFLVDAVPSFGISASLPITLLRTSNAILKGVVLKNIQNVLYRLHFLHLFACVKRGFKKMSKLLGMNIVVEIKQILFDLVGQIYLVFKF